MAISGLFLPIFLTVAIWPIWGFYSPFYILIMTFGYFMALTFLPGGNIGIIMFWLLFIGIATLSHTLPHAGHEHSW
jgi:hypothetical protein